AGIFFHNPSQPLSTLSTLLRTVLAVGFQQFLRVAQVCCPHTSLFLLLLLDLHLFFGTASVRLFPLPPLPAGGILLLSLGPSSPRCRCRCLFPCHCLGFLLLSPRLHDRRCHFPLRCRAGLLCLLDS